MPLGVLDRAPDARLQRAEWLAREWEERPPLKYEDPAVAAYAEFLHALSHLSFQGKERYMIMHPVLAEVHFLVGRRQTLPTQIPSLQQEAAYKDRALTKALVLCNLPADQIAGHLGFKTQAIKDFEYLAFNVRHRLGERGYIHNHVLTGTLLETTSARDFEQQLLRQAYMYGIDGVRPYMGLVLTDSDLDKVQDQLRRELALKAKVAASAMPINSHTAGELLSANANYSKNKADDEFRTRFSGGAGGTSTNPLELQQRILGLIGGIGLSVAPTAVESDAEKLPKIEQRVTKVFEAEVLDILQESMEKAQGAADG